MSQTPQFPMKPNRIILPCLRLVPVGALCLFLLGCGAGTKNPWIAPDKREFLAEKVKTYRNAYVRFGQAEDEARKDGNTEALDHYVRAKEAARVEMDRYERELAAYEASKSVKPAQ